MFMMIFYVINMICWVYL